MTERKKQGYVPILDLTEQCKNKRVVVVGDIHGMFDEFQQLLTVVKFDQNKDVLILAGDLIDRGPKIKETLEYVRNTPNVYTVLSNHDDKLLRYLRGNKVNIGSMQETIDQCGAYLDDSLRDWIATLPCIIKFDTDKYIVHAGINPNFPMDKQKKEFCLYARHFNPVKNSFSDHTAPMWWTYDNVGKEQVFFGHQPMPTHVAGRHIALDGGCVFGEELRAWTTGGHVVAVKATASYQDLHEYNEFCKDPLLVEDTLYVKKGLLSKKEQGDLVLYNYTQKCQFENTWDETTLKSRGIIYDKTTKEVVSYVMKKFFNLGENEFTQLDKLPLHLPFEVYEKLDGSMISCSNHKGQWIIATRGSFESDQAKEARKIIRNEKNYNLNKDLSYIFEVLYPENRVSPGARLVVDYGSMRDVVLLTAFDKTKEGLELTRAELEAEAIRMNMPICKKYDLTLEKAIEQMGNLPSNEEGYVVRFSDGTRIKLKGNEYIKLQKILNGTSPLSIWESFTGFGVPTEYLKNLPEEIRSEAETIAQRIFEKMDLAFFELKSFMLTKVPHVDKDVDGWRKQLGLWLKSSNEDPVLKKMVFPWILGDNKTIFEFIKEKARPKGNNLE